MKWVAAAILAGAGIWAGATLAFYARVPGWRWIAAAIAVEAIIVAGAILIPKLRPKMLLGAGVAIFMTAIAVAFLIPRRWCFGYNWSGGPPYDCYEFLVWGRTRGGCWTRRGAHPGVLRPGEAFWIQAASRDIVPPGLVRLLTCTTAARFRRISRSLATRTHRDRWARPTMILMGGTSLGVSVIEATPRAHPHPPHSCRGEAG